MSTTNKGRRIRPHHAQFIQCEPKSPEPTQEAQTPVEIIDLTSDDSLDDIDASPVHQDERIDEGYVSGQLNYLLYHKHYHEILVNLVEVAVGFHSSGMGGTSYDFSEFAHAIIDETLWAMIDSDMRLNNHPSDGQQDE